MKSIMSVSCASSVSTSASALLRLDWRAARRLLVATLPHLSLEYSLCPATRASATPTAAPHSPRISSHPAPSAAPAAASRTSGHAAAKASAPGLLIDCTKRRPTEATSPSTCRISATRPRRASSFAASPPRASASAATASAPSALARSASRSPAMLAASRCAPSRASRSRAASALASPSATRSLAASASASPRALSRSARRRAASTSPSLSASSRRTMSSLESSTTLRWSSSPQERDSARSRVRAVMAASHSTNLSPFIPTRASASANARCEAPSCASRSSVDPRDTSSSDSSSNTADFVVVASFSLAASEARRVVASFLLAASCTRRASSSRCISWGLALESSRKFLSRDSRSSSASDTAASHPARSSASAVRAAVSSSFWNSARAWRSEASRCRRSRSRPTSTRSSSLSPAPRRIFVRGGTRAAGEPAASRSKPSERALRMPPGDPRLSGVRFATLGERGTLVQPPGENTAAAAWTGPEPRGASFSLCSGDSIMLGMNAGGGMGGWFPFHCSGNGSKLICRTPKFAGWRELGSMLSLPSTALHRLPLSRSRREAHSPLAPRTPSTARNHAGGRRRKEHGGHEGGSGEHQLLREAQQPPLRGAGRAQGPQEVPRGARGRGKRAHAGGRGGVQVYDGRGVCARLQRQG
mmetsp:Transcript_17378/g.55801  ORF Transcript_17378/g.55801 Transcript_17378/m.55801 type:complete len:648 (-) Transcript_17378:134-2077(-)